MPLSTSSENAGAKQRGRPFQPGQSGNPRGKPKGTKNHLTRAAELLLENESKALTRKAVEMAMNGDVSALRLCIERIIPARRERRLDFALPQIRNAQDAQSAMACVLNAISVGCLTISEGESIARLLESFLTSFETLELEKRISALEREKTR